MLRQFTTHSPTVIHTDVVYDSPAVPSQPPQHHQERTRLFVHRQTPLDVVDTAHSAKRLTSGRTGNKQALDNSDLVILTAALQNLLLHCKLSFK